MNAPALLSHLPPTILRVTISGDGPWTVTLYEGAAATSPRRRCYVPRDVGLGSAADVAAYVTANAVAIDPIREARR